MPNHFIGLGVVAFSATTIFSGITFVPSAQAANLVTNGGFEAPVIPNNSFQQFTDPPAIPGWNLIPGSNGALIEIQSGIAGTAYEGNQFVELDSNRTTGIYQDIATSTALTYNLSFAFSPRPVGASGTPPNTQNILQVWWDNNLLGTISQNSVLGTTNWQVFNFNNLLATSPTTRLRFDNLTEFSNSYGAYLDAVNVTAVPTPALLPGLLACGVGALRRRKNKQAIEGEV